MDNLIDKLYNDSEEKIIFLVGMLMSSGNIFTKEDCESNIKTYEKIITDLESSSIPEEKKKEYLELCKNGIEVLNRDIEEFEKNGGRRGTC